MAFSTVGCEPSCPSCFRPLRDDEMRFRCNSGQCEATLNSEASEASGFERYLTPTWVKKRSADSQGGWYRSACLDCGSSSCVEVCTYCMWDIPEDFRSSYVVKIALAGARGAGKSVYTTVMTETLNRFVTAKGWTLSAGTKETDAVYAREYYKPTFGENRPMPGTNNISGTDAYQKNPMVWRITRGKNETPIYLVIRDAAGEDIEKSSQRTQGLDYFKWSDLTIFLYDPMRLNNVLQMLAGVIPAVNKERLGKTAQQVLPNVLTQMPDYSGHFALVLNKFDTIQQLSSINHSMVNALANPSAMFNRDRTFLPLENGTMLIPSSQFMVDSEILDEEIRGLLGMLGGEGLTSMIENTLGTQQVSLRHFAVSSLGETPAHEECLTVRGISPFRVLDPVLWVLADMGLWRD